MKTEEQLRDAAKHSDATQAAGFRDPVTGDIWEPTHTLDRWGSLESSNGSTIPAKSNYYYPLDPLFYADLLRRGQSRLVSAEIWPTNACNHRCTFCNSNIFHLRGHDSLPFDTLWTLVNDLADMGNHVIRFSGGGDPFFYEGMADIIRLITKRGMASYFITNGSLLTNDLIDAIAAFSSGVRFSLNAGNQADYVRVHGCDDFCQVKTNVQRLVRRRIELGREATLQLGATLILTPQNLDHLGDAAKTAKDCGLGYLLIRPPSPTDYYFDGAARDILKRQLALSRSLEDAHFYVGGEVDKFDGTRPIVSLRRSCYVTKFRAYINADGNVSCCFDAICHRAHVLGNLRDKRIGEIWDADVHRTLRTQLLQGAFRDFCHVHCANADFNRTIDDMLRALEADPTVTFKKVRNRWATKFALPL